jgi:hypothetical protein
MQLAKSEPQEQTKHNTRHTTHTTDNSPVNHILVKRIANRLQFLLGGLLLVDETQLLDDRTLARLTSALGTVCHPINHTG